MSSVPMLVYHKIDEVPSGVRHPEIYVRPNRFVEQLTLLRSLGFEPISLPTYLAYRRGETALPPRPLIVTFDDGYRSNHRIALPILSRFAVPATVFLVSRLIGRTNAWDADEIQEPLLAREEIAEMQRSGIDFQSHTLTHARLPAVAPAAALQELRDSRIELEQLLGTPVTTVAYPWGAHDANVLRMANEAGYEAGVIVRRRTNFAHTPLMALRRVPVWRSTTRTRLIWDLLRLRWRGD